MIEKIISKAPNLEKFRLGGVLSNTNSTRKISPSFCTLNKLEILELNDNNFGSIPNCFHYTSFPKLTVLDLTSNRLTNLANNFHSLNLTSLYLKNNKLGNKPSDYNNLIINNNGNTISNRENETHFSKEDLKSSQK